MRDTAAYFKLSKKNRNRQEKRKTERYRKNMHTERNKKKKVKEGIPYLKTGYTLMPQSMTGKLKFNRDGAKETVQTTMSPD
jgi:hypothetical protein